MAKRKYEKTQIEVYKGNALIAKSVVETLKEEEAFLANNIPKMTMTRRVQEGWRVFRITMN